MSEGIVLIVGLGNPGRQYEHTRHNAGAWFLDRVSRQLGATLRPDAKLHGEVAKAQCGSHELRLLFPTTYMNHSGRSVAAVCQYFRIPPQQILVAYDELDLPAGTARLKKGGGHGGHNGMRDIISALGTPDFLRLRIGIGHPGDASKVLNWVLGEPGKQDEADILDSIERATDVLPLLCEDSLQIAMNRLHTQPEKTPPSSGN